jgi:hypothetical protein
MAMHKLTADNVQSDVRSEDECSDGGWVCAKAKFNDGLYDDDVYSEFDDD